jgi:2-amino-4-hydroxy-6-hydroxymethyldihydropteridine diphosphokinase
VTASGDVATLPARVYVSVGSNIESARNLRRALREMERRFGTLARSSVYRTAAIGFDGEDFLNLVVGFDTALEPADVIAALDEIESGAGRERRAGRFASRTLDLDLLLYGNIVVDEPGLQVPRADILRYAFVLGPLAELAPDLVHPVERVAMRELWARFAEGEQPIRRLSPAPF